MVAVENHVEVVVVVVVEVVVVVVVVVDDDDFVCGVFVVPNSVVAHRFL